MEADGRPRKQPTSPWVYVGCGCGIAVLLALAGLAGLTWWGYQKGQEFERGSKDPKVRAEKTREVLPYRELPAGYYPVGAFSIPFLMDIAIFSDEEPRPGETPSQGDAKFDERGFVFMNMRHLRDNKEKMERFLRGEAPAPEDTPWRQSDVNFDPKEVIRRGTVTVGGRQVLYTASRGEVTRKGHAKDQEGIVTMVMPRCSDDRLRFGLWFGPDPAPEKPIAEADYTGTAADPAAIAEFLGHFELCGRRR
jgi:hypothetical protein